MERITVINIKGGCGKTTIATNLASAYAKAGRKTTLIDYDPQGSSMYWLNLRPDNVPHINGIAAYPSERQVFHSWKIHLPNDVERVIVDTPSGLRGLDLIDQLSGTHTILVPVLPSSIDTHATADFIRDLYLIAKVKPKKTRLCIVSNRVKSNTLALMALERFLSALDIPVIAKLRETQQYVNSTERGLGIHEMGYRASDADRGAWDQIIGWIDADLQADRIRLAFANV